MAYVKVDIDFKGVHDKFGDANVMRGRRALANQILADSNPYVPKKETFLRNATSVAMDGSEIYYHMQYAQKQYHNQFHNYTTPGTGPYWDEKAAGIHGRSWGQVYVRGAGL